MNEKAKVDTPEQAEYRKYCQEWLASHPVGPAPTGTPTTATGHVLNQEQMDYLRTWHRSAYEAGLVGCDYPTAYGGGGRTDCQRVANQEMQRAGTPPLTNYIALQMAAATILEHGTEEQKRRFIPKMLSAEELWCQGFSEPNAGSDLANAQTFAEKQGENWVINGQKIWTSGAQSADWMILLCRTDRSHKHQGLSYFLVPIKAGLGKSVDVRPLVKITGETGFNEVFFTNHTIPDTNRLDEEGKGWAVALTTLRFERGAGDLVTPSAGGRVSRDRAMTRNAYSLVGLAKASPRYGKTAADDPVIRDHIMKLVVRQVGMAQSGRRASVKGLMDHPMRIPMQSKVVSSEIFQDITACAVEIEGAQATLSIGDENAPAKGQWPYQYMNSFGATIAAGTSEIQRNQLGERILGMAKSK